MNIQFDLSDCTLSTEDQAVVDAVNEFLALLPDDADPKPALRLAMVILEAANVAPQDDLALVAGFTQSRSLREYVQRLQEEGLAGLWDYPIPGRPAITTRTLVEKALFQVILSAVIEEHALPDDVILANRVNQVLSEDRVPEAGRVTASMWKRSVCDGMSSARLSTNNCGRLNGRRYHSQTWRDWAKPVSEVHSSWQCCWLRPDG